MKMSDGEQSELLSKNLDKLVKFFRVARVLYTPTNTYITMNEWRL